MYRVFLIYTLRYQVTFAYSWGDPYIIRVTSAVIRSKRNKRAFRKFTSSSIHGFDTFDTSMAIRRTALTRDYPFSGRVLRKKPKKTCITLWWNHSDKNVRITKIKHTRMVDSNFCAKKNNKQKGAKNQTCLHAKQAATRKLEDLSPRFGNRQEFGVILRICCLYSWFTPHPLT